MEVNSSGVGKGSEFIVRFPVVNESFEARSLATKASRQKRTVRRRVLVVDDNQDLISSLMKLLKLAGHEVHVAADGLEAVEAAKSLEPDVILLDIGLPKLNGYEAARRIQEQHKEKHIVLVAVTGWGQEEDRRRSREAGFDTHMVKPLDFDKLKKLLAGLETFDDKLNFTT